ncbi:hypothetical protein V1264_004483 [Littorina saxatilis]|uniref:Carrier domain-containing protein n=3 Tax=Littorina saxatilis TaxID=31220 RepID=A0AAN9G8A0_9CAEN
MSPDRLLTMLTVRHRVSILQITPSLFRRFNPNTVKKTLLGPDSRLRVLAFGGETFPRKEMFDDCMHPDNGTSVYNVYGTTELSCWAALYCARLPKGCVQYPVPIGEALTGTKVKVVDEKGEDVTCGTGHILIGGAERTCLLNNEDEDLLKRGNVWRRTGDLGKVESDANIFCLGREDRQIKRNGKRLDLDTLEKVCREVDTVEDCHAVYTEATLHVFVRVEEHEKEEKKQLCNRVKSHVLETLPSQYQPDCLTLVTEFPVNSHGKLNASELLKLHGSDGPENQQPLSSAESWASKLWQDATCSWNKVPSPTDQFQSCGGDSLRAVKMVEQIDLHLGHQVPDLLDILLTRTFGDVLSLLQQHTQEHKTMFHEAQTTLAAHLMELSHSGSNKREIEETRMSHRTHNRKRARSLLETRRELRKGRRNQKRTNRAIEDLVEAAKPLPCFSHKDAPSAGAKRQQFDEDEPIAKARKLNTSGSDLGTGIIATVREKERQAVMLEEAFTFEETDGDSQQVKVLPEFSRSALPEASMEVKTAPLVCFSLEQKEQTLAAEKNTHEEITVRQEDISSDTVNSGIAVNSDCSGVKEDFSNDGVVMNVGRANTCLLTRNGERTYPCKHCQNQECHCDHERHRSKSMSNVVNYGNESDMSRLNDATRFISSAETAVEKSSVRLELQWAVNTGKCVDASPLVATTRHGKSIVYIGSHSHKFFAIDLKSGRVLWCTELGDRVEGSACRSPCGSLVVVGCYDSNIYMLSADTGKIEWQVKTGDVVKCSPVADSSHLVFCGSHDGFLYALHCKYQSVVWKCSAGGGSVFASPALSDDSSAVFAATLGGRITAMSVTTGKVLWSVSVGKPVFSSPTVHADCLCVGCVDSTLYCLSCAKGDQMWTFKADAPIFSSPVVTKATRSCQQCILFGCHDNNLYCISESGQVLWRTMTSSTVYASPFVFCLCGRVTTGQKIKESVEEAAACNRTKHNVIEHKLVDSCTDLQKSSQRQEGEKHIFTKHCPAEEQEEEQHSFAKHCPTEEQGREQHSFAKHCPAEEQERDDSQALKGNCTTPQSIGDREGLCAETSDSGMQSDAILTAMCSHDVATSGCRKLVACGSTKGMVAILCCETGEKLGSIELPGDVFSSPVVVGDRLVVGCRDDSVYCYKVTV